MAAIKCPDCGSKNYERQESLGGDYRVCQGCNAGFYIPDDEWQVDPPPLWSTYRHDPEPQI